MDSVTTELQIDNKSEKTMGAADGWHAVEMLNMDKQQHFSQEFRVMCSDESPNRNRKGAAAVNFKKLKIMQM